MNLRDLKYLVAVAKYKHFGKAAEACFVSQPALSMQLKKLEEELGVQLFERTNKRVMITQVGRDITERAQRLLREADEIKEVAKMYQNPLAGEICLGAFPTLAPYFFPQIVPTITEEFPELKLLLMEEKTEMLIQKLHNGELDAAVLAIPLPKEEESLEYIELFNDEFLLAVSPKHKFAKRKSITRNDLCGETLLLLEDGHCLRDQALDICSLIGANENQNFRATSLETLRAMVAANAGITLIPEIAKKDSDEIVYIPFHSNPPARKIALVWRKTHAKKECCKQIVAIIKCEV